VHSARFDAYDVRSLRAQLFLPLSPFWSFSLFFFLFLFVETFAAQGNNINQPRQYTAPTRARTNRLCRSADERIARKDARSATQRPPLELAL